MSLDFFKGRDKDPLVDGLIRPVMDEAQGSLQDMCTVENFEGFVEAMQAWIFERLDENGLTIEGYRSDATEESPHISSITYARSAGLSMQLRQEMSLSMRMIPRIAGIIDIEHCSNILAAYVGAFSVMLHELGHHITYFDLWSRVDFTSELVGGVVDRSQVTEILCDRIGFLLGRVCMRGRLCSIDAQNLYWISKSGLLVSFYERMEKGMYEPSVVCKVMMRFILESRIARKERRLSISSWDLELMETVAKYLISEAGVKVTPDEIDRQVEIMRKVWFSIREEDILGEV